MTTPEVSFYYDWGRISINRFLTSNILNTSIIRPHFCTYQSKLLPMHMWGFAFEKKNAKAPYPYRKKNYSHSFLFFSDIWGTNNWIFFYLLPLNMNVRVCWQNVFFLIMGIYNGKRISDMKRNWQTAQDSFLFDIKIIGLKILWRRSRSENWSKILQTTNCGLCMESWP